MCRKVLRERLAPIDASLVETLERLDLAFFKTVEVTVDTADNYASFLTTAFAGLTRQG